MAPSKVIVSNDNDLLLNPPGKICAPMGIPHRSGGLLRSQSQPNMAMTCPTGWAAHDQKVIASRGREFKEKRRQAAMMSHSLSSGVWAELDATMRPVTSAATLSSLPGGGRTQGSRVLRSAGSLDDYDPSKHGWYHPLGQLERQRLADTNEQGSWVWTMGKARDHIGYGTDGVVDGGDVQPTAVSADAPQWLIGTRTLAGPFSTKTVPVRRCPRIDIEGREMKVRARTYIQGEGLSAIEVLGDSSKPPTPAKVKPRLNPAQILINQAKLNNLIHGGCNARPEVNTFPRSAHITYESHKPWFGR